MSTERTPVSGKHGLLGGQRTRSYGSLVKSSLSPIRHKPIEHQVQPGETLQGLALKYGVTMEQIKRANRLYTNDSIFQKKVLSIPVLSQSCENQQVEEGSTQMDSCSQGSAVNADVTDLSPSDYLKKMDGLINQSMQAAVKTCQRDTQFSSMEQLQQNSQASRSCSQGQQAILGSVPLTITKCTKKLRDREDEIFQL